MDRFTAMEAFVRVLDTGSFSAAARQLRIGQPAVSKAIAQLEQRLGVQLLLRSTRGLRPTEAGQGFYERAKRSLEEAAEADLAATGAASGLSGRLRFCAAVTFARLHIIPCLPAFVAAHPALAIEAILDDRSIDLIEEGIDVALRMGTISDVAVTGQRIGKTRRMVIGTPAYFERHGKPLRPADLSNFPSVIYAQAGGGASWVFRKGAETEAVSLTNTLSITAAEGVREAVFAGLGLCVTTEWMFHPELQQGRVEQILNDWSLPSFDLWALFPTGRQASAKARAFASFAADQLQKTIFLPE
ncbi:MAG: LysR family transcriptional regulator [Janthinobacterium lividum]